MKYAFLLALVMLFGMAAAHTVTMNFAIRTGNVGSDITVRANDTDFGTTPASLTFVSPGKKYMLANNTTSMTAIVSAGTLLNMRLNTSYNSTHYLLQMTQSSDGNRFLLAATNGSYPDIEDKLNMIEQSRMVSSTFGRFVVSLPASFPTFIRLEYSSIDLSGRAFWSGTGQLRIKNNGMSRGIPNVTIELVRK